jgi:uncharacterized membrane protein
VIAAVSIPLILRIVPPNRLYGFRTAQTLADRDLWFRANHFAGWALLIAAVTSAALLSLVPESARSIPAYELAAFVVPLIIAVVASFVYLRKTRRVAAGGDQ